MGITEHDGGWRLDDPYAELSRELRAVLDRDGRLRHRSPTWEHLLAVDANSLDGPLLDLVDHQDRARCQELLRALAADRPVDGVEVRLLGAEAPRWVRIRAKPRRADRDPSWLLGFLVAQDLAEERDRRHEGTDQAGIASLLDEVERQARLGHWEGDPEAGEVVWSPALFEIFGLEPTPGRFSRLEPLALVHPDDLDAVQEVAARLRRDGRHTFDFRIVRPDGQVRNLRQIARISDSPDGRGTRFVGTIQDLTEFREVERALRHSEDTLQRVLTATADGWWDLYFDGTPSFYSDRWWAICGYAPGELPSDPEPWLQLTHPRDKAGFVAAFDEVLASGARTFVLPSAALHRDGHRVPMVVRGLVDYDADGRPVRASGATSDVTEAHRAEVAKDQFISIVSHELRTPLTAISGTLELLDRGVSGQLPPAALELVDVAHRNTERLGRLIDDLLNLERLLGESPSFDLRTQRLGPVLIDAVADNRPISARYGVRLVLREPIAEVLVCIERSRIEQVLANLLTNAVRYAPAGSDIEVGTSRPTGRDDRIRIEVIDRGPGVPEGFREGVFERFVQANRMDGRGRGGAGLGLAISKEIVERHQGSIGVDSVPGRCCFWFELPVLPAPDGPRAGPGPSRGDRDLRADRSSAS